MREPRPRRGARRPKPSQPRNFKDNSAWQLTPDQAATLPPAPSQAEMHAAAGRAEGREFWAAGEVSEHEDKRYRESESKYWRYRAKPLWVMLVFGTAAVTLIVGQHWLPALNEILGSPISNVGWVRLCLLIAGGYCTFVAWPSYRPRGWTPTDAEELAAAREHFRRKRRS